MNMRMKSVKKSIKLYLEECHEPDSESEYEGDDGQIYMVRRLLLILKVDDETQQNKLFS